MVSRTRSRVGIGATAEATGLSIDTIRYYDRLGLLGEVVRDVSGRQAFSDDDVGGLSVLRCLRDTGMSMRDLRRFCAVEGSADPRTRRLTLEEHRVRVLAPLEQTRRELDVLDGKIAWYGSLEAEQVGEPSR